MALLDVVMPIFLVIALGRLLRAVRLITSDADEALSRLVFNVCAPALLFRSTARAPLDETTDSRTLLVLVLVSIAFALAVYLATGRLEPARRGVVAQGAHRSNMVFVGLPVVANAYGEAGLTLSAVIIGVMVVLYNLLAVLLLTLPHQTRSARSARLWVDAALRSARNPLIVACALGMLWSAAGLDLPVSADRALDLVGRVALPVALLSVGAGLELGRLRAALATTAATSVLKLAVYPGVMWLVLRACGVEGIALAVPVLLMAAPTAVVSYVMAREMQGDERLAGAIIIGSTVSSLATYLAWLAVLQAA
ncbi:MAG TPA: AEC family transporter [Candidatus Krumholzibacteria bacterium]|nr:AEC family transporter [Candidatus Krumholzibacteria bacterium]HPD70417.1 AEC family transporter [Candidatus Krumholzibacteria bacterium]HRY39883.1 AEC family transporter [Candidatus Krumholzibacteria bacterium]